MDYRSPILYGIQSYLCCKFGHIVRRLFPCQHAVDVNPHYNTSPPLPLDLRKPTLSIPITLRSPPGEEGRSLHEDELDRHVEDCLTRRQQIRRTLQGVWAFIKTRRLSTIDHPNA